MPGKLFVDKSPHQGDSAFKPKLANAYCEGYSAAQAGLPELPPQGLQEEDRAQWQHGWTDSDLTFAAPWCGFDAGTPNP